MVAAALSVRQGGRCSAYVRIYQERIRAVSNLSELIDLNLIDRIVAALGTEQEMRRWDLFVFSSGRRGMNSWLRACIFFCFRERLRACVKARPASVCIRETWAAGSKGVL